MREPKKWPTRPHSGRVGRRRSATPACSGAVLPPHQPRGHRHQDVDVVHTGPKTQPGGVPAGLRSSGIPVPENCLVKTSSQPAGAQTGGEKRISTNHGPAFTEAF